MSRRIIIVGGGAAGTLVAAHLARLAVRTTEIVVIEPRLRLGEGVAYSTMSDRHLLNVPAGGMSAFTDDAQHFARWSSVNVDSFVPRHTYARYLRETLESQIKANPNVSLRHVQQPARRITTSPLGVTAGEEDVQGDAVVIALGNSAPTCPDWVHAVDASRVVRDPWETGALERIPSGARVLCVGTGLTFVDVAITLAARSCSVTAISRHGLLPTVHATDGTVPTVSTSTVLVPTVPTSLSKPSDVTRWLRLQPDWRAAFAAIRPETQQLWRSFGDAEQRQFLRHARRYWDVHRHRMAPEVARLLDDHIARGSVRIRRGSAQDLAESHEFDFVVLCTGPDDTAALSRPPLSSLVAVGQARPGPHGMGVDTDADTGQLLSASGELVPGTYAIGPLRRGTLWESTAIPEIRSEARRLAALLVV